MTRFVMTVAILLACLLLAWECGSRAVETAVNTPLSPAFTATGALPVDRADATPAAPAPATTTVPVVDPSSPTAVPRSVSATGDPALVALVAATFPEDPATAFRIVECESGWDPAARSQTGDTGLFQINDIHRSSHGVAAGLSVADLTDPTTNVRIARILYDQSGWQPWVCY